MCKVLVQVMFKAKGRDFESRSPQRKVGNKITVLAQKNYLPRKIYHKNSRTKNKIYFYCFFRLAIGFLIWKVNVFVNDFGLE